MKIPVPTEDDIAAFEAADTQGGDTAVMRAQMTRAFELKAANAGVGSKPSSNVDAELQREVTGMISILPYLGADAVAHAVRGPPTAC